MDEAIEAVRKSIEALKAKRDEFDRLIRGFEATLEASDNGSSSTPTGKVSGKAAFQVKYGHPAWELVPKVFSVAHPILVMGEIDHALQAMGCPFKRGTVAAAVKRLVEEGTLKQVEPPRGSGYSYAYRLAQE